MAPPRQDKDAIVKEFRQELEQHGLIHDGDTIGTDDETLSYVSLHSLLRFRGFLTRPSILFPCSRFLRARHYNIKQATLMWKNCQHWRSTVEDVGIDALYREIDPFDVRLRIPSYNRSFGHYLLQYPEREHVFDCWPLYFHKVFPAHYERGNPSDRAKPTDRQG